MHPDGSLRPLARRLLAGVLPVLLLVSGGPVRAADTSPVTLGRLEMIEVRPGGRTLKARIDTGAGLTSIDARKLTVVPASDGRPERATFRLRGQPRASPSLTADVIDWVEIKGKGTKRTIRRPVVLLSLCIGARWVPARVNLADRSGFLYPLLIGRSTLIDGGFVVDPAGLYLEPPRCPAGLVPAVR